MIRILHIDTANQYCSVALSQDENLLDIRETAEKNAHSRVVTMYVDELLKSSQLEPEMLDAISVSMGPGSYTGLRIGVSTAKGLCYALNKPLIAVSTLQAMAIAGISKMKSDRTLQKNLWFCPMIDARRMEVYSAVYDYKGKLMREIRPEVIDENAFADELEEREIVFSGDGSKKCAGILAHQPNAIFLADVVPSAKFMIPLALEKFNDENFEDTAYFEPFYLKDFIAGKPRVKGLK